jgi:hypothetical protein
MLWNLTWKDLLTLTVVGSFVTVLGNFIAVYLKDVLATRSLERWKAKQSLDAIYDRYRRPICTAAEELSGRCYVLAEAREEWRKSIGIEVVELPARDRPLRAEADQSFYRYRLLSDAYRLCCFLGWLELYRRDLGIVDVERRRSGKALEDCIRHIRGDLADGHLNFHPDRMNWSDFLIFREEQRAIAHRMLAQSPSGGLIDYGTFCETLQAEMKSDSTGRWFASAVQFFSKIGAGRDFRQTRMKLLVVHLAQLRELLQPGSVRPSHLKGVKQLEKEVDDERRAAAGGAVAALDA